MKLAFITMMVTMLTLLAPNVGAESVPTKKSPLLTKNYGKVSAAKNFWNDQVKLCSKSTTRTDVKLVKPAARAVASTCSPFDSILYGGQAYNTGTVSIQNDDTYLYINLNADTLAAWKFFEIKIYVSTAPVPVVSGNIDLSLFPVQNSFVDGIATYQYAIPLADIGVTCGTKLNMSIYTLMKQTSVDGSILKEEEDWFYSSSPVGSGYVFEYTPCCSGATEQGCTLSKGFYATHSKYEKKPALKIPWLLSEDTLLCGKKWYDLMNKTPKSGDAWLILAQQWIAAKLNVALGASTGPIIDAAISNGESMLSNNCSGISKSLRQTALEYSLLLEDYNNGFTGPGQCK